MQEALLASSEAIRYLFSNFGRLPLLCVALQACCGVEIVDELHKYAADVNAVGFHGESPLRMLQSMKESDPNDLELQVLAQKFEHAHDAL